MSRLLFLVLLLWIARAFFGCCFLRLLFSHCSFVVFVVVVMLALVAVDILLIVCSCSDTQQLLWRMQFDYGIAAMATARILQNYGAVMAELSFLRGLKKKKPPGGPDSAGRSGDGNGNGSSASGTTSGNAANTTRTKEKDKFGLEVLPDEGEAENWALLVMSELVTLIGLGEAPLAHFKQAMD